MLQNTTPAVTSGGHLGDHAGAMIYPHGSTKTPNCQGGDAVLSTIAAAGGAFVRLRRGEKRPHELDWPNRPHNLADARRHARAGGNVGVLCGHGGLVVLDCDAGAALFRRRFPDLADTLTIGRRNAPDRAKYTLRVVGDLPKSETITTGEGLRLEVLARGRQAVVWGLHDTGARVEVLRDAPIREVSGDDLARALAELRPPPAPRRGAPATQPANSNAQPITGDPVEQAARALDRLGAWRCDDYRAWVNVGLALSDLGAAGLALWREWSQSSDKYTDGCCDAKWGTFTPHRAGGLTLRSLFHWANQDSQPAKEMPSRRSNAPAVDTPPAPWWAPPADLPGEDPDLFGGLECELRAEALAERRAMCGARMRHVRHGGRLATVVLACGDFRNCAYCRARKAAAIRARLRAALGRAALCCGVVSEGTARALVRKHGRANMFRIPQPGGRALVVVAGADPAAGAAPLEAGHVSEDPAAVAWWESVVAQMPPKRRTSGHLGADPEPATTAAERKAARGETVAVTLVCTSGTAEQEDAAWQRAQTHLRDLAEDAGAAECWAWAREATRAWVRELLGAGLTVTRRLTKPVRCDLIRHGGVVPDELNDIRPAGAATGGGP